MKKLFKYFLNNKIFIILLIVSILFVIIFPVIFLTCKNQAFSSTLTKYNNSTDLNNIINNIKNAIKTNDDAFSAHTINEKDYLALDVEYHKNLSIYELILKSNIKFSDTALVANFGSMDGTKISFIELGFNLSCILLPIFSIFIISTLVSYDFNTGVSKYVYQINKRNYVLKKIIVGYIFLLIFYALITICFILLSIAFDDTSTYLIYTTSNEAHLISSIGFISLYTISTLINATIFYLIFSAISMVFLNIFLSISISLAVLLVSQLISFFSMNSQNGFLFFMSTIINALQNGAQTFEIILYPLLWLILSSSLTIFSYMLFKRRNLYSSF